jgi:hypothetical protein
MTKTKALRMTLNWLVSGNFVYPTALRTAIEEALAQPEAEAHLQAVSDFGQLQAQIEERNFCHRCGTRLMGALGPVSLHTCCPPNRRTFDDYGNKIV